MPECLLRSIGGEICHSSYVYVDPNLFFVNRFDLPTDCNYFYTERDNCLSLKLVSIIDSSHISSFFKPLNYSNISIFSNKIRILFAQLLSNSLLIPKKLNRSVFIDRGIQLAINHKKTSNLDLSNTLAIDLCQLNKSEHSFVFDMVNKLSKKITLIEVKKAKPLKLLSNKHIAPFDGIDSTNFKIVLVYPKQVENQANELSKILSNLGFSVVKQKISPGSNLINSSTDLHIIMCANAFGNLPQTYVCYQFEQAHSRWFIQDYLNKLNNSVAIWEYSEYNIEFFKGKFSRPHTFVPINSISVQNSTNLENRSIDILFYGEYAKSKRRSEFINSLKKLRPNLMIVDGSTNLYGESMTDLLSKTKIVINHHYYDNGNLEVVRVYEALSYGCVVISEKSVDDKFHNLPILTYSTVDQANELITQELAKYEPVKFLVDRTPYVRTAISKLGFKLNKVKRTSIFAHYDMLNVIDDYVILYLTELNKICDDIIFVSDCDLNSIEILKIDHLVTSHLCKKHGEANDFGSFKRGFELLKNEHPIIFDETTELIFANDSSYCVGSLQPMFNSMQTTKFDAWSLLDHAPDQSLNRKVTYMQTNFMVFTEKVFRDSEFHEFWNSVKRVNNKTDLVRKYEIRLSDLLSELGYTIGCYISSNKLSQYIALNSNQFMRSLSTTLVETNLSFNKSVFNTLFNVPLGGDYAYSDHTYSLLELKSPLVKCLCLVPTSQVRPGNKLIHYWKILFLRYISQSYIDLISKHIARIGKIPHSPNTLVLN
jgi:hypothetical protein